MDLTLRFWRQTDERHRGRFRTYSATDVSPEMSFLAMLDTVNENLTVKGEDRSLWELYTVLAKPSAWFSRRLPLFLTS